MYGAPNTWDALMRRIAAITTTFLTVQIEAGARIVQLFDSWVGALPDVDYRRYVLPYSALVLDDVATRGVPRIHFGVGTSELLPAMREAGADVVGVDFRLDLADAARRLGRDVALQGNLDPAVLFAPWSVVEARARRMLAAGDTARGHIANLGHGVLPQTDPDQLARLVELVHSVPVADRS